MRIAIVTAGFNAGPDDHPFHYLEAVAGRLARQHQVTVLATRYPYPARNYQLAGVNVTALGALSADGWRRIPLLARALTNLLRAGRSQRFDVIHAFWSDEPGFSAAMAGRLMRTPVVVSFMGGELAALADIEYGGGLSRVIQPLSRIAVAQADSVTAGSTYLHDMISERFPKAEPILLPLGVETDRFREDDGSRPTRQFDGRKLNLLQVGGLAPVKDHHTSLRAFAAVLAKRPEAHFHLLGHGPSQANLERFARELGVGEAVTFHGHVPWPEVPDYYAAADLYLHSSRHEAQGMAILEAAACGLPIVATAVGIVPDLPQAAIAVPVGDWRAMAQAVLGLVGDRDRRHRMAQAGPEAVKAAFTVEHYMERLVGLYEQLVDQAA